MWDADSPQCLRAAVAVTDYAGACVYPGGWACEPGLTADRAAALAFHGFRGATVHLKAGDVLQACGTTGENGAIKRHSKSDHLSEIDTNNGDTRAV